MIVIADNDILTKLACCDLCAEFSQAFSVSYQEIFILNTAKHVLKSNRTRKKIDQESFERLSAFLDSVSIINFAPDAKEQVALTEQQNIDAGEAVLFSVTHQLEDSVLTTGDKRSLESLSKARDAVCRKLCRKLAGKVYCFEQVIWKIVEIAGFENVHDKLVLGRECDKVLAIVIGSGLDATESNVREGLASYVEDLRRKTGLLLVA